MRYVILHYHIMKNAGSTVEEILGRSFWENFHRLDAPDINGSIQDAELRSLIEGNPSLQAVTSYQMRYPVPQVPGCIFLDLCVLRDPIDRIRSMYYYLRVRPEPGDQVSEYANGLELGDFVQRMVDEIPWYVNDVQVNLLANGIVNDIPERKDFERAKQRMLETSFLGVVDCFNESLAAGQYFLSSLFPTLNCAQSPVNVSPRPERSSDARKELSEACDSSVYAKLLELNLLDCELVQCAREEVQRRFETIPNREAWLRKVTSETPGLPWPLEVRATKVEALGQNGHTDAHPAVPALKGQRGVMRRLRRYGRVFGYQTDYQKALDAGFEGLENHPLFDSSFYLRKYADVGNANPLHHYLEHGALEQRQPHPLFDASYYLKCNPDVRKARMNPLLHYVLHGARENRQPHPLFLPYYYLTRNPEARGKCGGNPLIHFLESDPKNCGSPHPLFDCEYYLHAKPEVAAEGINPLVHYVLSGKVGNQAEVSLENFQTLRLVVQSVTVVIVFVDAPDEKLGENIVQIWKDGSGRTQLIAPPQQRPFFQAVSYDQLYAQLRSAAFAQNAR